ncbi:2-aminoethanethiol dioxygenase-like [Thamnophis elegans]|uniref:2-aminoethanethiol dioxygenase-like n=1 Tax=Thamnophis elegans TaxID=35005 RepID=UPI0013781B07|nr:2-aminoethanethiol dioxygenase-like [Thamnophis elegans]
MGSGFSKAQTAHLQELWDLPKFFIAISQAADRLLPIAIFQAADCLLPIPPEKPPVSYTHICEMARFVLRAGTCIPLHDHPGIQGLLKVLYGTLRIACFDEQPEEPKDAATSANGSEAASCPGHPRRLRALLCSHCLYTASAPPCLLSPQRDNLHQIAAEGAGPAVFLNILAPPYDPARGRDCHYYRLADGQSLLAATGPPCALWLLETTQAPDFWCGGEPYPGPRVYP